MSSKLNINIGAKIADIKSVQADIQAQLERIGKGLNVKIDTIKIGSITNARSIIQEQINQVTGKLTVKIDNIKVSTSALKSLKDQLSNTALDINANVKTGGSTEKLNEQLDKSNQKSKEFKESIGAINTQALDQIDLRLQEINNQYDQLAKKRVTFDGTGQMASVVLTYKNALEQVVTETYGWKQVTDEATQETSKTFGLLSTNISNNYEAVDTLKTKIVSLKEQAQGLIQSFANNGNLNSDFVSNLNEQLSKLGNNDNLKKAREELSGFVSYLNNLKTSESQILTLKKSMDKLSDIKGKLTDGKTIELMSPNQANAVQQAEVEMEKMQKVMTQLQNGATKTSSEIKTLTTASQDAVDTLKTKMISSQDAVDTLKTKIVSLKKQAQELIKSFANNGNLNSDFITNLNTQLSKVGNNDNLKKTKEELADFVSYLNKLKTSENQILTLKKAMDKLAEAKGGLINSKTIELMTPNQANTVRQVEAEMQKMQNALTQLQNGATKTSSEIRTLTTTSQEAIDTLKTKIVSIQDAVNTLKKIISLKEQAQGVIQSFANNGNLNTDFISNLNTQLSKLGNGDNLKKAREELSSFVGYLNKLKTNENQILTLKKAMDKLADIKGKLTNGKTIQLMTSNQASAVQQVEAEMSKMQNTINQLQNGATKTSTEIRTLTTASQDAGNKLKLAFESGNESVSKLGSSLKTVTSYLIGGGIMIKGIQAIKNAFSELAEIDKNLIDISRVASESLDLSQYTSHANELGMALNQTTNDILETAYAVQKLGYDLEGSGDDFLKWSAVFSNVGDIDINTAMTDLVTILKGFNMEASQSEHIIDAFNNVSNNMAISAGDIGEAFKSSASNLHLANTTLEEGIGLITGATEVLQDAKVYWCL